MTSRMLSKPDNIIDNHIEKFRNEALFKVVQPPERTEQSNWCDLIH